MESHFLLERSIETAALFGVDGIRVDDHGSHYILLLVVSVGAGRSERGRAEQGRAEQGRAEQGIASTGTEMMAVIERSFIETSKSYDLVVGWEEAILVFQFQEPRGLETVA